MQKPAYWSGVIHSVCCCLNSNSMRSVRFDRSSAKRISLCVLFWIEHWLLPPSSGPYLCVLSGRAQIARLLVRAASVVALVAVIGPCLVGYHLAEPRLVCGGSYMFHLL